MAVDDGLVRVLVAADAQGGIVLGGAGQERAQLVLLLLRSRPRWPPGTAARAAATARWRCSPVSESVSPARVSESFGTTMMSPALALFTSTASLPIMTYSWPRRSFLPVRALTSSMPGSSTPESTFRKLRRPTNGSDTVLNTNAAGRLRTRRCGPHVRRPSEATVARRVREVGADVFHDALNALLDDGGTHEHRDEQLLGDGLVQQASSSSWVSCSSPSRYFIISSSSASATRSHSLSRACCATSAYFAGGCPRRARLAVLESSAPSCG